MFTPSVKRPVFIPGVEFESESCGYEPIYNQKTFQRKRNIASWSWKKEMPEADNQKDAFHLLKTKRRPQNKHQLKPVVVKVLAKHH